MENSANKALEEVVEFIVKCFLLSTVFSVIHNAEKTTDDEVENGKNS